jgi:hypothetical protein
MRLSNSKLRHMERIVEEDEEDEENNGLFGKSAHFLF